MFQDILDKLAKKENRITAEEEIEYAKKIRENKISAWKIILGLFDEGFIRKPVSNFETKSPLLIVKDYDKYGDFLRQSIDELKLFNLDEIPKIIWYKKRADDIVNKFALANARLAFQQMHSFKKFTKFKPDDIFQEAMIALVRAANSYDHDMGTKFSTHAYPMIRNQLQRSYANVYRHTVRIPVHKQDAYWHLRKIYNGDIDAMTDSERSEYLFMDMMMHDNEFVIDKKNDDGEWITDYDEEEDFFEELFENQFDIKAFIDEELEKDWKYTRQEKYIIEFFLTEEKFNAREIAEELGLAEITIKIAKRDLLYKLKNEIYNRRQELLEFGRSSEIQERRKLKEQYTT